MPAAAGGPSQPAGAITAHCTAGPATDADRWPRTDAEIYEFRVQPDRTAQGHGSRLLHAAADTLVADGFQTVSTWVVEADREVRQILERQCLHVAADRFLRSHIRRVEPFVAQCFHRRIGQRSAARS